MTTEFATDSGPECACTPGYPGLWYYLATQREDYVAVEARCACCKRTARFDASGTVESYTIHDVKAAHSRTVARK